jgi:hypothetical protein
LGTALVTDQLESKIASLRREGIDFFFGGTLFEKFCSQRKVDAYYDFCRHHRCRFVEISNGTVDLPNRDKAGFILDFAAEFRVLSEVGYKDTERSQNLPPAKWIGYMREDLAAGAAEWREVSLLLAPRVPRDRVRARLPEVQCRQGWSPLTPPMTCPDGSVGDPTAVQQEQGVPPPASTYQISIPLACTEYSVHKET